jgi:hypothetical protein
MRLCCTESLRASPLAPARKDRQCRKVGTAAVLQFFLAAALAGLPLTARAIEAEPQLIIDVKSTVTRPRASVEARPDAGGSGRLYAVLTVQELKLGSQLAKPVDEARLTRQLVAVLGARGFRLASGQQKPGILLTVHYGRGWLSDPEVLEATVADLSQIAPGNVGELEKASYEKLFMRVTAWAYPSGPKARAQQLWQTTVGMDDPDHRDLNVVMSQMIAAAALYFGRATAHAEVSVLVPPPGGQVRVGIPVVVGEPTAAPKPPPPAVSAAVPAPSLTQFNLAAGEAMTTLQAFSLQSGEEIIYPAEQIRAVRTHAVSGEFSARAALDRMLNQTGLVAEWDENSGICIIHRAVQ